MPVSIGSELKLENNKVNAYYDNLFRKLNVAKAWTNTQTTESGGTVSVINSSGIIYNISSGYNDWYIKLYPSATRVCVIGGKLYVYNDGTLSQIGSDTNWKICSTIRYDESPFLLYATNANGKLYKFDGVTVSGSYTSMTEIGSGINWTYVDKCYGTSNFLAIGDGKLYRYYNGSIQQIGSDTGWTKIMFDIEPGSSSYILQTAAIRNGYVYFIDGDTLTLMNSNNDFIDVIGIAYRNSASNIFAINSSGELYWQTNNGTSLTKSNFNNGKIKQISSSNIYSYSGKKSITVITEDNKLYYNSNENWYELCSGINWTWAAAGYNFNAILAIGNGKLYSIVPSTSGGTMTQIGSISGYKKVFGHYSTNNPSNYFSLAWTGNATQTETTVYTTNNPIANDKAYSDVNLTEYSTVQSCDGSTLTDNFRTYQLDTAKNSSFTNIPPATIHETIKAIDIIRATE